MTDNFPLELNVVFNENCKETMKRIPDNSIDAIVTDPPYGLGKEPDALAMLKDWLETGHHDVKGKGFMGKDWDAFVPQPQIWRECLRILKPGGHLLSFGGTRTYDLVVLGLRIAGFEIREQISWVYGSGFPKSLDISKALDKMAGAEREVVGVVKKTASAGNTHEGWERPWAYDENGEIKRTMNITAPATAAAKQWQGWGTALKPAFEPIVIARKPLTGTVAENVLRWGTGGINVDGCRVGTRKDNESGWSKTGSKSSVNRAMSGQNYDRLAKDELGTGRFPSNFIHDGSEEVMELFPETTSGAMTREVDEYIGDSVTGFLRGKSGPSNQRADSGSAARFFYCAKASKSDRNEGTEHLNLHKSVGHNRFDQCEICNGYILQNPDRPSACKCENPVRKDNVITGNHHPTVKPTSLLKYLCRLVTPPNGIIYDPFSGSGSTGKAAILEGFNFIGSELDAEYTIIANARIQYAIANKDELDEKYVLEHIEKVMPKSVPTVKDNEYF